MVIDPMIIPPLLTVSTYQSEGYVLIGDYLNPHYNNHHYIIYVGHGLLVFQSLQIGKSSEIRGQTIIPLVAVTWLIDTIENKFWLPASQGGLPKNIHFVAAEIEGEQLVVQRCMNAGADGEMGFSLYNKSRAGYVSAKETQHSTISDYLLAKEIFPSFKEMLAANYM